MFSEGESTNLEENMNAFRMDQKSGVLSTRSQLDREKASHYSIIVNAIDQASPVSERRTATYLLPYSNYSINLFSEII